MKRNSFGFSIFSASLLILISVSFSNCKKTENPIKFPLGEFPDTLVLMEELNTVYDDYNTDVYELSGTSTVIFSSNRKSTGGQFDLEQAIISFIFDKTTGSFSLASQMSTEPFLDKLIKKAETPVNDFGPYRFFSAFDGYEYFLLSSENGAGNLDLTYCRNRPVFAIDNLPEVEGPFPVKILNSSSDDAYFSIDSKQDSVYFCSGRNGDFDIYLQSIPAETEPSKWFNMDYSASIQVDSVNTASDDKCPMVFKKILIFTSNRPGGLGGYDLYFSVFRNGNWSFPENMGPRINSANDEYRPLIGFHHDFSNNFLMFSSNRPGGKGGYDLYFMGYTFPTE